MSGQHLSCSLNIVCFLISITDYRAAKYNLHCAAYLLDYACMGNTWNILCTEHSALETKKFSNSLQAHIKRKLSIG